MSAPRRKTIGKAAGRTAVINAVVPFVFLYGRLQGRPECEARALKLLEQLPAEKNTLVKQGRPSGWSRRTPASRRPS